MVITHNGRLQHGAGGIQGIHSGIDAFGCQGAVEHRGGVQVGEGGGGSGVGEVVSRDVDGLDRRDRTFHGGGDALLQGADVGAEGGLVAHSGRHAAQQSGHFGAGLHEAEDVVDEQQHVLLVHVTEVLRHGQCGEAHAHAGAGGLVHLAVAESHLRLGEVVGVDHSGLLEFLVEVVALTGALTHAAEHGHTTVFLGDVVDQFLNQNGLADTGTTEQADLAALAVGSQQVDHLDAGLEHPGLGLQLGELGSFAVDGGCGGGVDGALLVNRLTENVEDAAESGFSDGHGDRGAGVDGFHAAHQTVGAAHGNGADAVIAQQLLNLGGQSDVLTGGVLRLDAQSVVDLRQFPGWEFHVQNRANHLANHALGAGGCRSRSDHKKKGFGSRRSALGPIQSGATIPLLWWTLPGSVTRTVRVLVEGQGE